MNIGVQAAGAIRLDAMRRSDPLESFKCAVWAGVETYRCMSLDPPPEVYWPASNMGAKTRSLGALDVCFLSGRDRLMDWEGNAIRIPVIKPPVAGALVVPSYKLASGSIVAALRELLGDWPHHEGVVSGAQDAVAILYVKHRQSRTDDYREWSRLYLFPHEGEVPQALRLDFAHADEPPPERMWRAVRNRAKAGRPFYRYIGATPWERRFWQWLYDDFPVHEQRKLVRGRIVFQSAVWDNKALHKPGCPTTPELCRCPDILRQLESNQGAGPFARAALYGDHVDASGTCPFDADALLEQREKCEYGKRFVAMEAGHNGDAHMTLRRHDTGDVRVWGEPAARDRVLVIANPSAGIPPVHGERKPSHLVNLQAVSPVKRQQLLRFCGYLTPPELGLLARAVCNRYREWVFVPEMNGGWGEEMLRSFLSSPAAEGSHGVVYQDVDPTSTTGNASSRVGWWQTENRRNAAISALQRAILEKSLGIFSRDCINNLLAVTRNGLGRYDDPETGTHPRDFLVLGMACSIMENGALVIPEKSAEELTPREAFERSLGITLPDSNGFDLYADDRSPWR